MTMASDTASDVASVTGPDGRQMRMEDLPSADTKRWTIFRKAAVVCSVRGGLLSFEDACRRWHLSAEELTSWMSAYNPHRSVKALRATRK